MTVAQSSTGTTSSDSGSGSTAAGSCVPIDMTSPCAGVIAYDYYQPTGACPSLLNAAVNTQGWSGLSDSCRSAVAYYTCSSVYKPCGNPTTSPPVSLCAAIAANCTAPADQILLKSSGAALSCANDNTNLGSGFPTSSSTSTSSPSGTNSGNATVGDTGSGTASTVTRATVSQSDLSNTMYNFVSPPRLAFGHCEAYTGSFCSAVIQYPIYIGSIPQSAIESQLQRAIGAIAVAPTNYGCRDNLLKTLCGSVFPRCDTTTITNVTQSPVPLLVAVPDLPSTTLCTMAQTYCGPLFQEVGLNCSGRTTLATGCQGQVLASIPKFADPVQGAMFPPLVAGSTIPLIVPADNLLTTTALAFSSEQLSALCPAPLIYNQVDPAASVVPGSSCATPCETLIVRKSDWDKGYIAWITLTTISFVLVMLLLITWTFFNPDLAFTPIYFIAVSLFFLYLPMFFTLTRFNHPGNRLQQSHASSYICESDISSVYWESGGYGLWMSLFFVYFVHALIVWLLLAVVDSVLINMAHVLDRWSAAHYYWQIIIYHVLGWGLPAITTIIILADHNLGCDGTTLFCYTAAKDWSFWILNGFTIMEAALASTLCNILILYDVCSKHKLREANSLWHVHQRLIFFTITFIMLFTVGEAVTIYAGVKSDDWTASASDWISCILANGEGACPRPDFINRGAWFSANLVPSVWGIFLFLYYLSYQDLVSWTEFLCCRFDALRERRRLANLPPLEAGQATGPNAAVGGPGAAAGTTHVPLMRSNSSRYHALQNGSRRGSLSSTAAPSNYVMQQ